MSRGDITRPSAPVLAEARRVFAEYARTARRATLMALPTGEPREYLYDLVPSYFVPSSAKYLRPVLCLAACRAHGGRIEDALPSAAALELLHNAFLIHDDIQDGSPKRRGNVALWKEHGAALAMNAGDALAGHVNAFLAEKCRPLGVAMAQAIRAEFDRILRETTEGQSLELGWRRAMPEGLRFQDYVTMATKKTSWYSTIAPIRIGALIGGRGRVDLDRYNRFGSCLGGMFQIRNDLASIEPRFGSDGHGPLDDIYEGKATLALIHFLGAADIPDDDKEFVKGYFRQERNEREQNRDHAKQVRDLMVDNRSVAFAINCFEEMAREAESEAALAFRHLPDSPDRRFLMSIATIIHEEVKAAPASAGADPG